MFFPQNEEKTEDYLQWFRGGKISCFKSTGILRKH